MRYLLLLLLSTSSFAMTIESEMQFNKISYKNLLEKWSVNYFMNFNGPKLNKLSSDETFDRFQTGKDLNNFDMDGTNNLYYFSSISLSYKLSERLSMGVLNFTYSPCNL
jgi:hypothetical protein